MKPAIKILSGALALALYGQAALANEEESAATWYAAGQHALHKAKHLHPNFRHAKNVIFFVGDGMGVSTVTAARILDGQMQGRDGEKNVLAMEALPYLALSKTFFLASSLSGSSMNCFLKASSPMPFVPKRVFS